MGDFGEGFNSYARVEGEWLSVNGNASDVFDIRWIVSDEKVISRLDERAGITVATCPRCKVNSVQRKGHCLDCFREIQFEKQAYPKATEPFKVSIGGRIVCKNNVL